MREASRYIAYVDRFKHCRGYNMTKVPAIQRNNAYQQNEGETFCHRPSRITTFGQNARPRCGIAGGDTIEVA